MKEKPHKPSRWIEGILETLLFRGVDFGALVDYQEQFARIAERHTVLTAYLWYLLQIILAIIPFIHQSLIWSFIMIRNYMKVALRNLKKQKLYALVNLTGLAVGMAFFALFALSAAVKLHSDRFHENGERMYCVIRETLSENQKEVHSAFVPAPMLPVLRQTFPEIEDGVNVYPAGRVTVKYRDASFYETRFLFVDANFLTFCNDG